MTSELRSRTVSLQRGRMPCYLEKPGGWVLVAAAMPGEDLRGAAMRFRVALFGGRPATRDDVFGLLSNAGFTQPRALPSPPRDFKLVVAARAPS